MRTQLAGACLALVAGFLMMQGCSKSTGRTLDTTAIEVEVEPARAAESGDEIAYSGTIEESETLPLSFSSIGTVSRVLVSEGDHVRKGQLLAELNDGTYRHAFDMANATLHQAEDAHARVLPMHNNGNFSDVEFVRVETALQQARSAAAIAKKSLADCRLVSPIDGVVGKRSIDPGMSPIPTFASITVVKIAKVYARIPVPENEIRLVAAGQTAQIRVAAAGDSAYAGVVEQVGVMADPLAHTYKIKIGIQNVRAELKPGMVCTASLRPSVRTGATVIPSQAVQVDESGRTFVYAVDRKAGRAVRTSVSTGRLLDRGVEALSGARPGDLVVVAGQHKLVDNALVHFEER
jgi:membrane fusion protein, multidrug efflux system